MSLPYKQPRKVAKPETDLWKELKKRMRADGWYVKKTHGNKYQSGLPDVYASHVRFGMLWIELKYGRNKLEDSQVYEFSLMAKNGSRIFVIREISEYPNVLYGAPNWGSYGSSHKATPVLPLGCRKIK